jgi:transcriptional regulator with XRE-family HTH domain
MDFFGGALKLEREILGLSQAKFAAACGVGRTAQFNYERGERFPDVAYLQAASKLGVDVNFLLTGVRITTDLRMENGALRTVMRLLGDTLGIDNKELMQLIDEEEKAWRSVLIEESIHPEKDESLERATETVNRLVESVMSKRPVEIDSTLLATILEGVDVSPSPLSKAKKAQVVAMLYRTFKTSGKVDQKIIEEAIALAA